MKLSARIKEEEPDKAELEKYYLMLYQALRKESLKITQEYLAMLAKRKGVDQEWEKKLEIKRLPPLLGLQAATLPKEKRGRLEAANKYWGGQLNPADLISREEAMELLYACPFKLGPDWAQVKNIQDESDKRLEEKKREEQMELLKKQEAEEQRARLQNPLHSKDSRRNEDLLGVSPRARPKRTQSDAPYDRREEHLISRGQDNGTFDLKPRFHTSVSVEGRHGLLKQKSLLTDWRLRERLMSGRGDSEEWEEGAKHRPISSGLNLSPKKMSGVNVVDEQNQGAYSEPKEAMKEDERISSPNSSFHRQAETEKFTRMFSVTKQTSIQRRKALSMEARKKASSFRKYPTPIGHRVVAIKNFNNPFLHSRRKTLALDSFSSLSHKVQQSQTLKNEKLVLNLNLNPDFMNQTEPEADQSPRIHSSALLQHLERTGIIATPTRGKKRFRGEMIALAREHPHNDQSEREGAMHQSPPGGLTGISPPSELDLQAKWGTSHHYPEQMSQDQKDKYSKEASPKGEQSPSSTEKRLLAKSLLERRMRSFDSYYGQPTGLYPTIWEQHQNQFQQAPFRSKESEEFSLIRFYHRKWLRRAREDILSAQIKGFMKTHDITVEEVSKLLLQLYNRNKVTRLLLSMHVSHGQIKEILNDPEMRVEECHSLINWLTLVNRPLLDPKDKMLSRLLKELGHTVNVSRELDVKFTSLLSQQTDSLKNKPRLNVAQILGGPINSKNRFYSEYNKPPRDEEEEERKQRKEEANLRKACIRLSRTIHQVERKLKEKQREEVVKVNQQTTTKDSFELSLPSREGGKRVLFKTQESEDIHHLVKEDAAAYFAQTSRSKRSIDLYLPDTHRGLRGKTEETGGEEPLQSQHKERRPLRLPVLKIGPTYKDTFGSSQEGAQSPKRDVAGFGKEVLKEDVIGETSTSQLTQAVMSAQELKMRATLQSKELMQKREELSEGRDTPETFPTKDKVLSSYRQSHTMDLEKYGSHPEIFSPISIEPMSEKKRDEKYSLLMKGYTSLEQLSLSGRGTGQPFKPTYSQPFSPKSSAFSSQIIENQNHQGGTQPGSDAPAMPVFQMSIPVIRGPSFDNFRSSRHNQSPKIIESPAPKLSQDSNLGGHSSPLHQLIIKEKGRAVNPRYSALGKNLAEKIRSIAPIPNTASDPLHVSHEKKIQQKSSTQRMPQTMSSSATVRHRPSLPITIISPTYQIKQTLEASIARSPTLPLSRPHPEVITETKETIQIPTLTSSENVDEDTIDNHSFTLSQNSQTRQQKMFLDSLRTNYYNHYVAVFGLPLMNVAKLKLKMSPLRLKPRHVFVMAMRLGINLTQQMPEYDLIWIAQQAIALPLPATFYSYSPHARDYKSKKNEIERFDFLTTLPSAQHPGDAYFADLLKQQRKRRITQLKLLREAITEGKSPPGSLAKRQLPEHRLALLRRSDSQTRSDIIARIFEYLKLRSWLAFNEFESEIYYYSFILKQKKDTSLDEYPPHLLPFKNVAKHTVISKIADRFPEVASMPLSPLSRGQEDSHTHQEIQDRLTHILSPSSRKFNPTQNYVSESGVVSGNTLLGGRHASLPNLNLKLVKRSSGKTRKTSRKLKIR